MHQTKGFWGQTRAALAAPEPPAVDVPTAAAKRHIGLPTSMGWPGSVFAAIHPDKAFNVAGNRRQLGDGVIRGGKQILKKVQKKMSRFHGDM